MAASEPVPEPAVIYPRSPHSSWLQVGRSGRGFPIAPVDSERIDIEDIVPALCKICRYTGHCKEFYSVAQHSVHTSYLVPKKYRLEALLHDAAEAYTGDISTTWKRMMKVVAPEYWSRVEAVEKAVADHFGMPHVMSEAVKLADMIALATEKRDLMPGGEWSWGPLPDPDPKALVPLGPMDAEMAFWGRYYDLREELDNGP